MTKEQIRTKFDRWAERVGHTPFENDLDNATLLLSYDDKQTSTTFSTVAVYAVAVHTDHTYRPRACVLVFCAYRLAA